MKKERLIYNIIMVVFVLYAWLIMFFNTEEGMLTAKGLINGIAGNDIYGFLRWGYPAGLLIFAVICFVAFLTGMVLRLINAKLQPGE